MSFYFGGIEMSKAEYRSSIRSKNLIKRALAKLLHEKDISKITVTDVIGAADISRGTFYAHFSDIYSVLDQIENEELSALLDLVSALGEDAIIKNPRAFVSIICNYIGNDFEYYKMLILSNLVTNNFLERLSRIYNEKALENIESMPYNISRDEATAFLSFICAGVISVFTDWLNGTLDMKPDEVANTISDLIISAQGFFHSKQEE